MKKINKNDPIFEMIIKAEKNNPIGIKPTDFSLLEDWQADDRVSQLAVEGQLAVDVAQTETEVVIVSTIAGAIPEKLEVYLRNDLLTIRGVRQSPMSKLMIEDYFHQECYWGKFSRSIVLPVDVKTEMAKAEYNNGVLLITIPKQKMETKVPIFIVEE
ncbi:MAG TPA: Hsp20/alpha crystallin family protein [Candidatus Magasanikbacteria bacterium]|jgi:HSP20 family protein|nr:Hsp20/alpha crystallin family protein [Candidatus Magasanikbacteria bacterium]HQF57041.1 Hsp20/alpha crystallin family protein [Candidatus Magasanikbacteria bacterium]HQL52819.1 Hsp20/alpha crystallin family protein [Candidatus Magasanikbacteria bacterium]